MAKLNEAVQCFIVHALACYDTPSQVAAAVKEEFGLELTRQQVATYDATKHSGRNMSKKWRDLFEDARKRFRQEVAEIPIAGQAYRLRQLQRLLQDAIARKNVVLASQLLEQAAKEEGGLFTNRRQTELTGKGGGPVEMATLSKAEYKQARKEMLANDDC